MNIGRVIAGRYEVQERLGSGSLFVVFKARERTTGRSVAVKTIHPEIAADASFCNALLTSLHRVEEFAHPGIARLLEVVIEDGKPALITEFVRGMNLKERIKRIAPFTVSVAVDFAIAIAEALQYMHANGVIHGDLRPQNVMVGPDGLVKVIDLGIAAAIQTSAEASSRSAGRMAYYQAPEVALQGVIMAGSDLYALGAILYEMLTGAPPYPTESANQAVMKHQTDPVPSPRAANPGVPRALDGIVRKALQKRPEQRYASAADLLADLKTVRDALRFGRPLTWTPFEEPAGTPSPEPVVPGSSPPDAPTIRAEGAPKADPPVRKPRPEPPQTTPVERNIYVARDDDRIAGWLRGLLYLAMAGLFLIGVFGLALWFAAFTRPDTKAFPDIIGKPIEEAQRMADAVKVRLLEREEYNDQYDPGTVYRVDYESGRPIRPGRTVLVWVSRGSRLVWVPDVSDLSAGEAEAKLKAAGLTLGRVNRETSDKVPFGCVVSQNPRSGKRVDRDTPVTLILSDGSAVAADSESGAEDQIEHEWTIQHTVKRDGGGRRQVRIEYEDAEGSATAFDDVRDEGDVIDLQVRGLGRRLIVRVYYNDDPTPISENVVRWEDQ